METVCSTQVIRQPGSGWAKVRADIGIMAANLTTTSQVTWDEVSVG